MKALLLVVLAAAAAACGGSPPPAAPAPAPVSNTAPAPAPADAAPGPVSTNEALAAMGRFKDELCKCADTSCVQKVSDEMTRWATDLEKTHTEPPKMSDADEKAATALGTAMGECMQRAMGSGAMTP